MVNLRRDSFFVIGYIAYNRPVSLQQIIRENITRKFKSRNIKIAMLLQK